MTMRYLLGNSMLRAPDDGGAGGGGAAAPVWTEGLDADIVGHAQAHGWDKLDPAAAAREGVKSHRELLQKMTRDFGDPNQLVRIPKDINDAEGYRSLYTRLGVPVDPKEYTFDGIKAGDGSDVEPEFLDYARNLAASLHLPKDAAPELVKSLLKFGQDAEAADAAERTAKITEEKAALTKNWGNAFQSNLDIAKQAAGKLGVSPEAVAALEGQVGYANVMEMFLKIGQGMGEHSYINSGGPNRNGVLSREQAIARKADLMQDAAFAKKVFAGDATAVSELRNLDLIIVGVDDTEASRNA